MDFFEKYWLCNLKKWLCNLIWVWTAIIFSEKAMRSPTKNSKMAGKHTLFPHIFLESKQYTQSTRYYSTVILVLPPCATTLSSMMTKPWWLLIPKTSTTMGTPFSTWLTGRILGTCSRSVLFRSGWIKNTSIIHRICRQFGSLSASKSPSQGSLSRPSYLRNRSDTLRKRSGCGV